MQFVGETVLLFFTIQMRISSFVLKFPFLSLNQIKTLLSRSNNCIDENLPNTKWRGNMFPLQIGLKSIGKMMRLLKIGCWYYRDLSKIQCLIVWYSIPNWSYQLPFNIRKKVCQISTRLQQYKLKLEKQQQIFSLKHD